MSNPKDTLEKAKVVDANGNPVGSADDVMLDKTGKPSSLKVDVGGFLGVGDKDVAMKASGCCQSNANFVSGSPTFCERHAGLCREDSPLGLGIRASLLVSFAADEVAFLIEVVLDRGVNGAEFLQRLHAPKPEHRMFSPSERLMRVFRSIVHPAPAFLAVRDANDFHRCAIGTEPIRRDTMWFAIFLHEAFE